MVKCFCQHSAFSIVLVPWILCTWHLNKLRADEYCPSMEAVLQTDDGQTLPREHAVVIFDAMLKYPETRYWMGNAWIDRNQIVPLGGAAAYYTNYLETHPKDAEALRRRAAVYCRLGHLTEALLDFNEALTHSPNHALALTGRSRFYLSQGSLEQSIRDSDRALELLPDHAWVHIGRAEIYLETKRLDQCIAELKRALILCPRSPDAAQKLAHAFHLNDEQDASLAQYDLAKKLTPNWKYEFERTFVLIAKRDYPKAIEYLKKYELTVRPQATAHALLLAQSSKVDEAIKLLDGQIRFQPKSPSHYYHRGLVRLCFKQDPGGIADLSAALAIDPNYAPALTALILMRAMHPDPEVKNSTQAIALSSHALRVTGSQNPNVLFASAAAIASQGDFTSAIRKQQQGIEQSNSVRVKKLAREDLVRYQRKELPQGIPSFDFSILSSYILYPDLSYSSP